MRGTKHDYTRGQYSTAPDCRCVFCGRVWQSKEYQRVCPVCLNSADPRVPIPEGMRSWGAASNERLRLAMLFIEEWSNWWSYALGKDDNAPVPPEERAAAEKMAESLGVRARDMVIDNRRFLAGAVPECGALTGYYCGPCNWSGELQKPKDGSPKCPECESYLSLAPLSTTRNLPTWEDFQAAMEVAVREGWAPAHRTMIAFDKVMAGFVSAKQERT